jgi:hypothetical protein
VRNASLLFVTALVLASFGFGCSKTGSTTASNISRDEVAEFLAGEWAGAMQLDEKAATKTLEAKELEYLRTMKMDMVFHKSGQLDQTGEDAGKKHSDKGTWEFVGAEESESVIRKITINSKGSRGEPKPIDLVLDGDDAFEIPLTMKDVKVGAMRFERRMR